MKKMILSLAVAAVAVLFAGCVSVETVKGADLNKQGLSVQGQPLAHINVQNWGIYLLNLPIFTGSTESVGSISVFKDTVNPTSVVPVLTKEGKKLGSSQVLDITSQCSEFGLLFVSRTINVSGNAVR